MPSFANQVVLITGAGSGLGAQLAIELLEEGARVAAIDLRPEGLAELEWKHGGPNLACATADVTDRNSLMAATSTLVEKLGPVDLLIASAGIGIEMGALGFEPGDFERQIAVNLVGVANSVAAVLPQMIARRQGHLSVLSSLASYRGLPRLAGYSASKAGVNALFDALRVELRPRGIAVTTLCPGFVRTPMTRTLEGQVPLLELDDAVRRILQGLRMRKARVAFPRGTLWRVRLLAWLPATWSDWLVARSMRRIEKKRK